MEKNVQNTSRLVNKKNTSLVLNLCEGRINATKSRSYNKARSEKSLYLNHCLKKIPRRHANTERLIRYLVSKYGMFNRDSTIYVSQATLARESKCSVSTIYKSLYELQNLGLIMLQRRKKKVNNTFQTNLLFFNWEIIEIMPPPDEKAVGENTRQYLLPKGNNSINTKEINTDFKKKCFFKEEKDTVDTVDTVVEKYYPTGSAKEFLKKKIASHSVYVSMKREQQLIQAFKASLKRRGIIKLPQHQLNYMFFANAEQTTKMQERYGDKYRPLGDRIAYKESRVDPVLAQDKPDYISKLTNRRLGECGENIPDGSSPAHKRFGIVGQKIIEKLSQQTVNQPLTDQMVDSIIPTLKPETIRSYMPEIPSNQSYNFKRFLQTDSELEAKIRDVEDKVDNDTLSKGVAQLIALLEKKDVN